MYQRKEPLWGRNGEGKSKLAAEVPTDLFLQVNASGTPAEWRRYAKKVFGEPEDDNAGEEFSATMPDGRPTLFIDDIVNAITYVTQHIQPNQWVQSAIDAAYISCLTFVFQSTLKTDDKDPKGS